MSVDMCVTVSKSIQTAARSKAWVFDRSLLGIAGSNLAGGMNVCCECCVLSDIVSAID